MNSSPRARSGVEPVGRGMLRLAHRGDHRLAPENTLDALRAAVAIIAIDGVEFDVRGSAGGVAILLHDATLARVQGRSEAARWLSAGDLARLGVPTLEAALAVVPSPSFLDIELKEDVAEQAVAAVRVSRGDPPPRVVLSSFDVDVLGRLRSLVPSWPRWLNSDLLDATAIDVARRLGCSGVSAGWRSIDQASMTAAAEAGLEVAAWTVTSPAELDRLETLGVIAVCVEGEALGGP